MSNKLKKGNVVKNKETNEKKVIFEERELGVPMEELVCEAPHDDGDFSYFCYSDYCRCGQ